jgi:hypothetical protein
MVKGGKWRVVRPGEAVPVSSVPTGGPGGASSRPSPSPSPPAVRVRTGGRDLGGRHRGRGQLQQGEEPPPLQRTDAIRPMDLPGRPAAPPRTQHGPERSPAGVPAWARARGAGSGPRARPRCADAVPESALGVEGAGEADGAGGGVGKRERHCGSRGRRPAGNGKAGRRSSGAGTGASGRRFLLRLRDVGLPVDRRGPGWGRATGADAPEPLPATISRVSIRTARGSMRRA